MVQCLGAFVRRFMLITDIILKAPPVHTPRVYPVVAHAP